MFAPMTRSDQPTKGAKEDDYSQELKNPEADCKDF